MILLSEMSINHISFIILNDFLLKFNFYNRQHFCICYLFIDQINAILQSQLLSYAYERELHDFKIFILKNLKYILVRQMK